MRVIFLLLYGVVIVTSDIRSSHHSDEEKTDLASQQTVRVKRTLPKDTAEQHGPTTKNAVQQNKDSVTKDLSTVTNTTNADAASSKRFKISTRYGNIRITGVGRRPRLGHICFGKNWRKHVNLVNVCITIRGEYDRNLN
ncbi:uncharacterized protein [Porites lutea]|uniref:uncharacterized protein n=1 Tax=Porites lutea TaxID=51062 RepID=UPI003CC5F4C7